MTSRLSPELLDRLAAEYTLGTLHGGARRRFQTALRSDPEVALAVARWQQRLLPLDDKLKPVHGGAALWARIERQAFGAAASEQKPLRWWQRLLSPLPAGALAAGLLLGSVGPALLQQTQQAQQDTQLPESYIGVLANAQGQQGMLVSSLRRGKTVDLKQLSPVPLPPGRTLFLWAIDAAGRPSAITPLPNQPFASLPLAQPAEALFGGAVELAVSAEPLGTTPAAPSLPYVYRGLCGKLWPASATRPASAPPR